MTAEAATPDQEGELGDVESPGDVAAQAGDAQAIVQLPQVADEPGADHANRNRIQIQYRRLPTIAFSNMNIADPQTM